MQKKMEILPPFATTNLNKAWVSDEIDKLIGEWTDWSEFCISLTVDPDSPNYDPQTCSDAIKDGVANRDKHKILREKTLVFLRNHFSGAEFILDGWDRHPYEDVTSRLSRLAPYWLHRLQVLKASMDYVQVPDSYWHGQSKKFLETLSKSTVESAIDVAKSYLKNPLK